jgi:DNA modification methylase
MQNNIIIGDAWAAVRHIGEVQSVITSPPWDFYSGDIEYSWDDRPLEYADKIVELFGLIKVKGVVMMEHANHNTNRLIINKAQSEGWHFIDEIHWYQPDNDFTSHVTVLSKIPHPKYYNVNHLWQIDNTRHAYYDIEFSIEFARECVEVSSAEGDMVLDPFAGSGAVGKAAILTNRFYTLVEIIPQRLGINDRTA